MRNVDVEEEDAKDRYLDSRPLKLVLAPLGLTGLNIEFIRSWHLAIDGNCTLPHAGLAGQPTSAATLRVVALLVRICVASLAAVRLFVLIAW